MRRGVFDIYQTRSGYVAVDNVVQRQILEALGQGDQQLPELVEITGKSKPTLSAGHMKQLLTRELVEELPHPTDKRRKVYRLIGERIGSSDIPVPQLRRAVESYVALSPVQPRLPAAQVLDAVAAGEAPREVLREQGRGLGRLLAAGLRVPDERTLWMRVVRLLEDQEIARAMRIDLEAGQVEWELLDAAKAPLERWAPLLAGVVAGAFDAVGLDAPRLRGDVQDGRVRLRTV